MAKWTFQLEKIPPILDRVEKIFEGETINPIHAAQMDFFKGNSLFWMGDNNVSIQTLTKALSHKEDLPEHVLCNVELILNVARQRNGEEELLIHEINQQLVTINSNRTYYIAYTYGSLSYVGLLSGKLILVRGVAHRMQMHASKNNIPSMFFWSLFLQGQANGSKVKD